MNDLLAARAQMAMSLGFHILFAVAGMAMPLLMVIAEGLWLWRGDAAALDLAKRWAKGVGLLFAVGAVSGTVLSFELGLLWPEFMRFAGPIIGMPFSLEGFAFFLEAICLGVYLYGWEKVSPRAHWLSGVGVLVAGTLSGVFVVTANAWMNTPTGFTLDENGAVVSVDPLAAMLNPAAGAQVLHMVIAAFQAVGFLVAGIHALGLLRNGGSFVHQRLFHQRALSIGLLVGGLSSLVQPLSGDFAAKTVAETQPLKLAAMEAHWETSSQATLSYGGWADEERRTTHGALEIPYALSILAFNDPDAEVKGLDAFPEADWPPVAVTHLAFDVMVTAGMVQVAVALWAAVQARRRRLYQDRRLLKAIVVASPLGLVAIEAGWTVTEVGRQPWVIAGILRTEDAVTPMGGLGGSLFAYTLLYLFLGVNVVWLLRRTVLAADGRGPS